MSWHPEDDGDVHDECQYEIHRLMGQLLQAENKVKDLLAWAEDRKTAECTPRHEDDIYRPMVVTHWDHIIRKIKAALP